MQTPKKEEVDLYSRFSTTPCEVPETCIVDTNVFLGAGPNISDWSKQQTQSALLCVKVMEQIDKGVIKNVVLDGTWYRTSKIFDEYCHKLSPFNGQSIAEKILRNLAMQGRFQYRKVTPQDGKPADYLEFPKDSRLADFDGSDKKFVAVANAEDPRLPILQSMDGKWWKWAKPLHDIGIEILFTDSVIAQGICSEKYQCGKKIGECGNCPENG